MITLARLGSLISQNGLMILLLAALLGFVIIHLVWYIRPSAIDSAEELHAALTDGQPTVVEYYTNL